MLVLKDVLSVIKDLVLQGGKSSNQTSTLQTAAMPNTFNSYSRNGQKLF